MSPTEWPPTTWAIATAITLVVTLRPKPLPRRPGPTPIGEPPADAAAASRFGRSPARRQVNGTAALAHWCEAVARTIRSGSSLPAALDEVAGGTAADLTDVDARALDEVRRSIRRGMPIRPTPTSDADLALVVGVLRSCLEHGGAAAEPLDRVAAVLRDRDAQAAERRTQSAQARLSAQVMTLLPAAMLALLLATSPSVRVAVTTPAGGVAVIAGAALNLVGWQWQRRLIRKAAA